MNFTTINKAVLRTTAILTVFTMVATVVPVERAEAQAAPTCTIVSNASTQEGGDNSFVSSNIPGVWTTISGAEWIWGDSDYMNAPAGSQTFTKKFIVNGTSTAAELKFSADNSYDVRVNGSIVAIDNTEFNYGIVATYDVLSKLIMNAENTITITVTNADGPGNNPAGLVYKLEMTGNSCDRLPLPDLCSNIDGRQEVVPAGYTAEGATCYPTVIVVGNDTPRACIGSENLLVNGSFEDPVIATGYSVVATIAGWINTALTGFEIWNNQGGAAADGSQHLELDVDHPTTISQDVSTVVGNIYQVSLAFSPRAERNLADNAIQIVFDGVVIGSVSADGIAHSQNTWSGQTFQATADAATSTLEIRDLGNDNGYGSLVDDVRVCLIQDNSTPAEPDTYEIFGFVFDDTDEDDNFDEGEADLEGWTVRAVNASNTEQVITDQSDANGRYSLNVPAGTWIISQETENGWELLSNGNNGDGTYTVTVPEGVTVDSLVGFLNFFLPTAMAAEFDEDAGEFNFGNDEVRRSGGSRSSGTRVDRTPTGTVLGASTSTPTGTVLGDATTTMPVGAPNTGAGGTAPVAVNLGGLVAVLTTNSVVRKTK